MFDWMSLATTSIIPSIVVIGGLIVHYTRSETRQDLRYEHLQKILKEHESRIITLEQSRYQQNGQTTYLTRAEYLKEEKKRDNKCKDQSAKIKDICNHVNKHDIDITEIKSRLYKE